ncbi:MAG: type IV secretory system conjugative DNA transfer family protein, partial [Lachnospiraceae bacterium]|nr:type IV secretory system conjugative DNA transfer family protein [Lachnospiraceae bacterium]
MEESQRYNPFAYVYEDSDIPIMVDALISNIEGPKKGSGGDNKFWDETSRTLLIAICGYLFETQPPERRNFNNVVKLIDLMDVSDDRKVAEDELDKLFNDLEQANPSSYAVSNYKVIKSAGTGKTAQNIVISTLAIFARFFKLDKIANLTYRDELHLEEIGQKKCALFIVTPQGDNTYNFLASELYTQLFRILYRQGEENARRRNTTSVAVDVPVRCLIDEAANIGTIPYLPEKVSTMRKYGISIALIYQNQAQVKALFKDDWETIVGNCDTMLFLGGIDASTVKTVSERLGKETINTRNNTVNKGNRGGGSTSTQTSGRELMTTTEIEQMRNDHCIVFIRSLKPFCDWKYPLEEHPNFKYSGDADEMNVYHPAWHLTLDRKKMASLNIKLVGEKGYQKPVAVDWATEEERESVIRDQARRRAAGSQQTPQPPAGSTMQRLTGASCTNGQQAIMTQEECERIRNMIEEKKINLGLHEGIKIFNLSLADAEHVIELKDGFAPDLEYF